jgi:multidrug resistance efflux pump
LIAEVATLKTDMNAAKSDITAAEADITTAKADITTAKADITTAKADITSAESSIVTVQTDAGKALGHYPRYCRGPAAGLETFRPIFRLKKMVSGGTRHYVSLAIVPSFLFPKSSLLILS